MNWPGKHVVLAHDWLNGMRGGEKCLEAIARHYPDAPIYTLLYQAGLISDEINSHPVVSSPLMKLPGFQKNYRYFLPLFPAAIERFTLPAETDLVLSFSHCVAKGIRPPANAKHLCYCFTPMRYAWELQDDYFGKNNLKRRALDPLLGRLRAWDKASAARVDQFVAISEHIRKRIQRYYDRDSVVVYPPADTVFYTPPPPDQPRENFALVVSALVPYKRIDLAIRACIQAGMPLKIIGVGSDMVSLKKLAAGHPQIEFLGRVSNEVIREHYRRCAYLLFPGEEDFGIVPVEAQACGAPVVAYQKGGALETLVEDQTAVFFPAQTPESLLDAVQRAHGMIFDAGTIRANAERFTLSRFLDGMHTQIERLLTKNVVQST